MKKLSVVFLSDPGHGWVKVSREKVRKLGFLHKVSQYSYQNSKWLFLEEDCDAARLVEACKEQNVALKIKNKKQSNKQSKVRSYEHFRLTLDETREIVTSEVNQVGA